VPAAAMGGGAGGAASAGPATQTATPEGPPTRTVAPATPPPKVDRMRPPVDADMDEPPTTVSRAHPPEVADDATVVRRAPTGRPRLVLAAPGGGTREVPLTTPDVSIGRAKNCDVILGNAEVSRLHARIVARGPDHVLIPVGTRKNTYVNDEPAIDERLLRHGDVIRLANEELVYAEAEHLPARGAANRSTMRVGASAFLFAAVGGLAAVAVLVGAWLVWTARNAPPPAATTVASNPPAPPLQPAAPPAVPVAPARPEPANAPIAPPVEKAAPPAPAADTRAEQVSKLVYQGDIAFVEKKYTSPPDGSALYAYREALKLDPQNAKARSQIALIIERYFELAERSLAANDRASAHLYLDKAAYVHQEMPDVGDRGEIERRLEALGKRVAAPRR